MINFVMQTRQDKTRPNDKDDKDDKDDQDD
jgi:hypothetical protein